MGNAAIDSNSKATITGRLNTDGVTITRVRASPSTHAMEVDNQHNVGTDQGGTFAATDDNDRPALFAVSSAGDNALVSLYVSASGNLLIDSQ